MCNIMKKTYPGSKFIKIKLNSQYSREPLDRDDLVFLQVITLSEKEVLAEVIDRSLYNTVLEGSK